MPDPDLNPKFAHKLAFLAEMRRWGADAPPAAAPAILVGDLNVAPLENDVWSPQAAPRRREPHAGRDRRRSRRCARRPAGSTRRAHLTPEPEKIYTWWSYRSPDWRAADKGRRLDHVWLSPDLAEPLRAVDVARETRGWTRPSDHVPVTAILEL